MHWTLFAALLAGLLGMHVLTVGHGDEGHGTLPMSVGQHGAVDAPSLEPAAPAAGPSAPPDVSGPEGMAGCILFLAAGAGAAVLALLRRRLPGSAPSAAPPPRTPAIIDGLRRGPPPTGPSHRALRDPGIGAEGSPLIRAVIRTPVPTFAHKECFS